MHWAYARNNSLSMRCVTSFFIGCCYSLDKKAVIHSNVDVNVKDVLKSCI